MLFPTFKSVLTFIDVPDVMLPPVIDAPDIVPPEILEPDIFPVIVAFDAYNVPSFRTQNGYVYDDVPFLYNKYISITG